MPELRWAAISPPPGARRNWKDRQGQARKCSRWQCRDQDNHRGRNPRRLKTKPSGPSRRQLAGLRFGIFHRPDCDTRSCHARAGGRGREYPEGLLPERRFARKRGYPRRTTYWQHRYPDFRRRRNRTRTRSCPRPGPRRPLRLRRRKKFRHPGCGRDCCGRSRWPRTGRASSQTCDRPG